MAGKRQKHPDRLLYTRGGRDRRLQPSGAVIDLVPECPLAVTDNARLVWERLWESSLGGSFSDSDLPALSRWLWWYDQWTLTAGVLTRLGSMVLGVAGDRLVRSRVRYLNDCEANLQKLEEALGMTPLARMRLGISVPTSRRARLQPAGIEARDPRCFLTPDKVWDARKVMEALR